MKTVAKNIRTVFTIEIQEFMLFMILAVSLLPVKLQIIELMPREKNHSSKLRTEGSTVNRITIIPNAPTVFFIKAKEPKTDENASPIAPPTIGIILPERSFTPFTATLSAAIAIFDFNANSPVNIPAVNDSITVTIFFITDVMLLTSTHEPVDEYILIRVSINTAGIIKSVESFELISANESKTALYETADKAIPLAEITPVKTGIYASIKSDNSIIDEIAEVNTSDNGIATDIRTTDVSKKENRVSFFILFMFNVFIKELNTQIQETVPTVLKGSFHLPFINSIIKSIIFLGDNSKSSSAFVSLIPSASKSSSVSLSISPYISE